MSPTTTHMSCVINSREKKINMQTNGKKMTKNVFETTARGEYISMSCELCCECSEIWVVLREARVFSSDKNEDVRLSANGVCMRQVEIIVENSIKITF